jgi:RNA polymerase sigma-70 factor (ECF subfamily)
MTLDRVALGRGEPHAVDAFYRAHARTVLRWVIRLGGPRLDPEDTAHDVFLAALGAIGRYRTDAPLEPWLFGVTRRVVANARRRAWFRRIVGWDDELVVVDRSPGADARLDQLRRRRLVQEVLEQLTDSQREVLVLSDLEGRSAPEVAALLGIPVGTVYSRVHGARKQFAAVLGSGPFSLSHDALRDALREEP